MNVDKTTLDVLDHLSKFTNSVIIEPDKDLYVVSGVGDFIYARAKVEHGFEKKVPCHDIAMLVSLIKLFNGLEYNIEFEDTFLKIKSNDGKYTQQFVYGDEDVLKVPNPDKIDKIFLSDTLVEFELDSDTLNRLRTALKTNKTQNLVFEAIDGTVKMYGANSSLSGKIENTANKFAVDTSAKTDKDIQCSVAVENFVIADGDYTVKIADRFILFISETVSYVMPVMLKPKD